jgi:hypothetical protein
MLATLLGLPGLSSVAANPSTALAVAFVLGVGLAFNYQQMCRVLMPAEYQTDLARSQVMLTLLMSLTMLVVGDHLSRAFGAVGILSVMRFKTKIRNTTEGTFLLGAVALGMGAGVGMYTASAMGLLVLCSATWFVSYFFREESNETDQGIYFIKPQEPVESPLSI